MSYMLPQLLAESQLSYVLVVKINRHRQCKHRQARRYGHLLRSHNPEVVATGTQQGTLSLNPLLGQDAGQQGSLRQAC